MMEWFQMSSMFGGRSWVEAALLVCLFWAALGKPDRIRSLFEFRLAGLLLAAAIISPVMIQLLIFGQSNFPGGRGNFGNNPEAAMLMFTMAIPPGCLTLAVILGVDSVIPRSRGSMPYYGPMPPGGPGRMPPEMEARPDR